MKLIERTYFDSEKLQLEYLEELIQTLKDKGVTHFVVSYEDYGDAYIEFLKEEPKEEKDV